MTNDCSSNDLDASATPPAFHSAIGFVAGGVGAAVAVWSALKDEPVGIAVGVLFTILSVGAGLDAVTTRIWISGDRLSLRDHFLRIRSFKFSEIRSVTFVPGELFEIHLTSKQRIRFPAGSKNLDRISETLLAHIKIGEYDT